MVPFARRTGSTVIDGNGAGTAVSFDDAVAPLIEDNVVTANMAGDGSGGGIDVYETQGVQIVQNLITDNQATGESGNGGGVSTDVGPVDGGPGATLVNNTIAGNTPNGVYLMGGSAPPAPSTFDGNIVTAPAGDSAIVCENNDPPPQPFGLLDDDAFDEGPAAYDGCTLAAGAGDMSLDPGFVDAATGDYQLTATSPCVDTGDPTAPGLPGSDLAGNPRVQGKGVDMGVYEFAGTSQYTPHGPQTIDVPGDAPTIQAGIDDAQDGDTILVAPGTYDEHLDFGGKAITVASAEGPQDTIIDGGGTGTAVDFHTGEPPSAVLRGFTIEHGAASSGMPFQGGGGIRIDGASPTIVGDVVTDNTACIDGAGIEIREGSPLIEDDTISQNTNSCFAGSGDEGGGGIFLFSDASSRIVGNVITGNSWKSGPSAIMAEGLGPILIEDNVITGNHSSGTFAGPAVEVEPTVSDTVPGEPTGTVVQNLIAGNKTSGAVGGLDASESEGADLTVVNNTIAGNSAAGLLLSSGSLSDPVVDGNIVEGTGKGEQAIVCGPLSEGSSITFDDDDAYAGASAGFAGCPTPAKGSGDISANPKFVDATAGDYQLATGSPAIDAGDPTAPQLPTTDLDGQSRVQGKAVDMGAYEATPPPPPAAVTSLRATRSGSTITVTWSAPAAVPKVTSYEVTLSSTGTATTTSTAKSTSTKLSHLSTTTAYQVTVVAVSSAGTSPPQSLSVPAAS